MSHLGMGRPRHPRVVVWTKNFNLPSSSVFFPHLGLMATMAAPRCRPFWSILVISWSILCADSFQSNRAPTRIRNGCSRVHYQQEERTTTTAAPEVPLLPKKKGPPSKYKQWAAMIDSLQKFRKENGHSLVTEASGDPVLFKWTWSIRRNYRHQALVHNRNENALPISSTRPRLSEEKLQILQDLDFPWDIQSNVWDGRQRELQLYQRQHGHCRVPPNSNDFPGLGVWVRNQRREYKRLERGEKSTLTTARLQALRDLGFEWYRSHKDAWESRYQELSEYYQQHDNSNVPEDYADNFHLGQWCMNQRTAYKRYAHGEPTALTADRIQLLEEVDFRWSYREHRWHSMQERLKQYHELHGNVAIATDDETNMDLRGWLILQRYHYNRRKQGMPSALTNQRIQAMETAIPDFAWKAYPGSGPSSEDWSNLFGAMRDKGIKPGARPKEHWFEGQNLLKIDVKNMYSDQDLLDLWNEKDEDEDDDDEIP
jgi:hypothetical protein